MPYSAKAVANFFLDLADADKEKIAPLKLLKLVYFAHGWHLALTGNRLLDEAVEAWKFGPVVPSIYHSFKEYKMNPITGRAQNYRLVQGRLVIETPSLAADPTVCAFLRRVWDVYGKMSGIQLSNLTHQADTPWSRVWNGMGQHVKGTDIPDASIREYFVAKQKAATVQTANA